jgi:putative DNA primase/helicase
MMDDNTAITADPFAPVSYEDEARGSPAAATEVDTSDVFEPIMPAPREPPDTAHLPRRNGLLASASWTYRNAGGEPLSMVIRYDRRDGGKDVLPYTCWRHVQIMEDGTRHEGIEWRFKAPPAPTPLYGLDQLAARPDAPVVVVEGEKTADAAALLFPDHVAVTSQGGAKSVHKADLSPLVGRTVTVWPDNDAAGATYATDVARLLQEVGAASVAVVEIPKEWAEGWDVADPHPDGSHRCRCIAHARRIAGGCNACPR